MRSVWCAILVGLPLLLVPAAVGSGPPGSDLDRLQGSWNLVGYADEYTGRDEPVREPAS